MSLAYALWRIQISEVFDLQSFITVVAGSDRWLLCQCAVEIRSYAEGIFDVFMEALSNVSFHFSLRCFLAGIADITLLVDCTDSY